ncbi:hypothetical protein pb186bvf_000628 [Paramecium bursaria]
MEFFSEFAKSEISKEDFVQKLAELTTKIQKKSTLTQENLNEISQAISHFQDEIFNDNIELFVKFALYISNRGIYEELNQIGFDKIQLKQHANGNQLGLYIIKRVYNSENHKVLILFLNGILRESKTVERKFVLLEIFVQILPKIEKKEYHLATILPLILFVINQGLQKYIKYRQEIHNNTFNENNQFTKAYLKNYQKWTVSFFTRIFDALKKQPEIIQQDTAIKSLLKIESIYDYYDNSLSLKEENPKLIIKHYALLFIFDLIQGIQESQSQIGDNHLDKEVIESLEKLTLQTLEQIHDNKLEIVENYVEWIQFAIQTDYHIPLQYHTYSKFLPYNPVAMCYLLSKLLDVPTYQFLLTQKYALYLLFGVLYEQYKLNQAKCDVQTRIIELIVNYLNQDHGVQFTTPNYYNTPFHVVLLLIMEKAGQGLPNEKLYIQAWQKSQQQFERSAWIKVIEQCLKNSQNVPMLSYLVNHLRQMYVKEDPEIILKDFDVIINTIQKKELGGIESKIQLIESLIFLVQTESAKATKDNPILQKHIQEIKKYENEIQQAINVVEQYKTDLINNIQVEDIQKIRQQTMLANENNFRIALYNLSLIV